MMKEQIKKEKDANKLKGNLSAYAAGSTNIIIMSATSSSAESACRLLKAGIDNYPKLSGYFQTGYLLKKIGSFEGNGITVNHADGTNQCTEGGTSGADCRMWSGRSNGSFH